MKISDVVDHIFVLNLDYRREKWQHAKNELRYIGENGEDFERFSAIDGEEHSKSDGVDIKPGALGCSLSHLKIYSEANKRGYEKIVVLEDDVIFEKNFNSRFERSYNQLPEDWQFLYLGGNHRELPDNYSENLNICNRTWATHAYLIGREYREVIKQRVQNDDFSQPVDNVFGDLQTDYDFFVCDPRIAIQKEGFSDVVGIQRNYDHVLKESGLNFRNKYD